MAVSTASRAHRSSANETSSRQLDPLRLSAPPLLSTSFGSLANLLHLLPERHKLGWPHKQPSYIGLANFRRLLTDDPVFWIALKNNLIWLLIFITIPLALGLALAMVLNGNIRGDRLFKVSFYSPMVLSFVVIGLIFSWLYHPRNGLINATLRAFGTWTT